MRPARRFALALFALYFLLAGLAILTAGCALTGPTPTCQAFTVPIVGMNGDSTGKVAHGEACTYPTGHVIPGAPAR